jgi:hypothetical protein
MNTEQMMSRLINGSLINILNAGTFSRSIAFIARDDTSPTGFQTIYQQFEDEHVGRQITPQGATDGLTIDESKRALVEEYLVGSFGLTGLQAQKVVSEAHAMLLAA